MLDGVYEKDYDSVIIRDGCDDGYGVEVVDYVKPFFWDMYKPKCSM